MTALLETKGLEKRFGGFKAVDDLTLTVDEGELHCLIGPNGAGKSTFFKLILGRYRPTAGTVSFKGRDLGRLIAAERIRRGISVKMQVPGVFPELPVEQNLVIALQSHFSREELPHEVERLLAFSELTPDARKLAGNLSHGQMQWLELAMAVGVHPTLLLLDEPTAGMSPEETFKTGEMVMELNRGGMTVLVVEHDMAFVRQIAKKVSVLHFGKLFAQGDIATISASEAVQEIYLGKGQHAH